jgi:DNA-binding MarR family transcriptional regulator
VSSVTLADTPDRDAVSRIGEALSGVFRAGHASRFHERVADEAGVVVDRTGFVLLAKVMDAPARISQLAERIGLDVSTTSRKVAELEAAGLVERTLDLADRRAAVISPTPRADDLVGRMREARDRAFADMLADWDPADRARLADLLERLVARMQHGGGHGGG